MDRCWRTGVSGLALCRQSAAARPNNGVPGGWGNRFKKRVFSHLPFLAGQQQIKFRPSGRARVGGLLDYNPNNPKSTSGSGLLGTGPRGRSSRRREEPQRVARSRSSLSDDSEGRHACASRGLPT